MKTKFTKTSIVWIALAIFTLNLSSCKDELPIPDETEYNVIEEGITGSLSWKLTKDSVLSISGKGAMLNYYDKEKEAVISPWYYYRNAIKTVVIDDGVTSIGDLAFAYCINLTGITISNDVKSIGSLAFCACYSLIDITIPNSLKIIGNQAFYYCSGLTDIIIPGSVTNIKLGAFYGCSGLTEMTVKIISPIVVFDICFQGVDRTIPVYVPQGSLQAYKNANVWKEFTNLQVKVF